MEPQRPQIRFAPVALKSRHDGWTADRQHRFIAELGATRSIAAACRAVGMSRESAYRLKDHPGAALGFALAWRRALQPEFVRCEARRRPRRRLSPETLERLLGLLRQAASPQPDSAKVDEQEEMQGPPN